jgi:hypothetical protein
MNVILDKITIVVVGKTSLKSGHNEITIGHQSNAMHHDISGGQNMLYRHPH